MRLRIKFNSPAILTFAALCLVVMLIGSFTGGITTELVFMTYHSSLKDPATYLRLFTHVLGHVDWNHFTSNMIYILLLGPLLEEKYGSKRIVQVIVITAFATGVINYLLFWNVALCGASGICFAFILLSSFTRSREGEIPVTFILVAAVLVISVGFAAFSSKATISSVVRPVFTISILFTSFLYLVQQIHIYQF